MERSITVSAPHRSAQRSFRTSSSVPEETGEAPMLALILVRDARPMAIGSRLIAAMDPVGRNDHPPGGDFVAHLLGSQVRLALGDAAHFRGHRAQLGRVPTASPGEKPAGGIHAAADS